MTSKPPLRASNYHQSFRYIDLDEEVRSFVEQHTSDIKSLMRRTAQDMIDIGLKLIEIKETLGHGKFNAWLKSEINFGEWTARKFMAIGRRFKSVDVNSLKIASSALYLITSKNTPGSAIDEILDRAYQGEYISHSTAKAIVTCHSSSNNSQDIRTKELKVSDVQNPKFTHRSTSRSASSRDTVCPALSDEIGRCNSDASKELSEFDHHSKEVNSERYCSEFPELIPGSREPSLEGSLRKGQIPKSPFKIGSGIYITTLDQRSSKWIGRVSKIQEQHEGTFRIVLELDQKLE